MFILSENNTVAQNFMAELRDEEIQKDSMRFRRNLERIGEIFAYEISKSLRYTQKEIKTALGTKKTNVLASETVLTTILRAGLPLHQGLLNYFDKSENAFIGAYRGKHNAEEDFDIEMDYITAPDIQGKTLIISDPMIATGQSIEKSYHALLRYGLPERTHIVAAIASRAGIQFLQERIPQCHLWIGDIDDELNTKSYIIPGLGDAGDLAFGIKN
ncbi:MAG: uracil phosphoribosyltransferase [Spirosomataceae bacterium]|jgi:uracil phosphoribosyltransferase